VSPGILLDKDAGSEDQALEKFSVISGCRVKSLLRHLVDFEVKFKIPENRDLKHEQIRR